MSETDISGADAGALAPDPFQRRDPPILALRIWPHRSLSRKGFAWVMGIVAAGLTLPLLPFLGSKVMLGLLPFPLAALLALWLAIRRSYFDGRLTEELRLWPDLIAVERREPKGAVRRWQANPYWARARLSEVAKIEKYLTLEGNGREIELGAFLSPGEREALYHEIVVALAAARAGPGADSR